MNQNKKIRLFRKPNRKEIISMNLSAITIYRAEEIYAIYKRINSVVKTYEVLLAASSFGVTPYRVYLLYFKGITF